MPEYLALEWDAHEIVGVAAQVSRKSVQVQRCFVIRWPDSIDVGAGARQAGDWLKQELTRQGIGHHDALVAVPREHVAVKPLELPAVPDDELPEVVRLQAATRSAMPLDQLKLDFIPAARVEGAPTRRVWLTSLPRRSFERVQHLGESAGLKLETVGVTTSATASVIVQAAQRRTDVPAGVWLVISLRGKRVEISLLQSPQVLFSHAAKLHSETIEEQNQAIIVEINRCLIAAEGEGALQGRTISHVWLLGSEQDNPALVDTLQRRFGCHVGTKLDPLTETGMAGDTKTMHANHWALAAPVGLLLSRAGLGVESIDFVNPHKPPAKNDRKKLKIGLAAAAVVLFVGWCFADLQMDLSDMDAQIESLQTQKRDLDERIKDGKAELDSAKAVEGWLELKVDWIAEFNELRQSFSAANGIYLEDFKVTPPTRGEIAVVKASGLARQEADIRALYKRLYEHNYQTNPYTPERNESNPEYPWKFELSFELLRGRAKATPPKPAQKAEPKESGTPADEIVSGDEQSSERT